MKKILVVMSGGQDSTTCLGVAVKSSAEVEAICFSYHQKHSVEIVCAQMICKKLNVPLRIISVPLGEFNNSALIAGNEQSVDEEHVNNSDLPASFVPARNATFLTLAHGYAQSIGADALMTGVCQTDYSGYPDCRLEFIESLEATLNLGYSTDIRILTPLMHITKAETFALAEANDVLDIVLEMSHTCYNGNHSDKHAWGFGCGECGACKLRAKGYEEFLTLHGDQGGEHY